MFRHLDSYVAGNNRLIIIKSTTKKNIKNNFFLEKNCQLHKPNAPNVSN